MGSRGHADVSSDCTAVGRGSELQIILLRLFFYFFLRFSDQVMIRLRLSVLFVTVCPFFL